MGMMDQGTHKNATFGSIIDDVVINGSWERMVESCETKQLIMYSKTSEMTD